MTSVNDELGEKSKLLDKKESKQIPVHTGYGARHTFTILSFIGYFNLYALRYNLSVAMVAMANHTDSISNPNASDYGECPDPVNNITTQQTANKAMDFDWDEATQGLILSSFFYGYVATQIPGGMLSERFGGKHLVGFGILIMAILTILTPLVAAEFGTWALITTRVIEGLVSGAAFTAIANMQGKWTPEMERTLLTATANTGAFVGNVIVLPVSGYLCSSHLLGGWPASFYIFGGVGCVWFLFWHFLIYETPATHPRISSKERKYIESTAGQRENKSYPTPWKGILTSPAIWAIMFAVFFQSWGAYITTTVLPTYMNKIQKFDITQDGLLLAIPNLVTVLTGLLGGWLADHIRRSGCLSTIAVRKLFTSVSLLSAALCLPFIPLAGCDHVVIVTLIVVGNGMLGFCGSGVWVSFLDIGFNFSGILMGLINFSSNVAGVISPYFVGVLTNNNETMQQWQTIFYVSMAFYVAGTLTFLVFGKGTEAEWNKIPSDNRTINDPNPDTMVQYDISAENYE
ncbi:sialin-like isoform X2 [Mizuhopecten yessoensis]|uniref:sialin-like isoform X2 n=1 Tax=Mizuhopecten yessoensis TaxID=6573 RepID=UPI000B459944|nr:sialin-like isoform X2 [Mizuhopecten yessoensis]